MIRRPPRSTHHRLRRQRQMCIRDRSYIVTSTSSGSYGGLARASYSSIRNSAVNAPSLFTGATDSSNIESRLRYSKNTVLRQGGPELCLAGSTYFNAACDAMSAKQRFTQNKDMLEANFDNIVIEGMTMVNANGKVFSGLSRIAADRCYGIRLDNVAFRMFKNYNFQPVQQRTSVNQLVDLSLIHISEPTRPCGTSRMPSSA